MIVNITGARLSNGNKGAQLMLATACERLRSITPDVVLTIPFDMQDGHADRLEYGLRYAVHSPARWFSRSVWRELLAVCASRTSLGGPLGLVHESKLDGILDISGYAFGDKWPVKKTKRLAKMAFACKRRGRPVILLPQMLGPFTKPGQERAFRELAQHCDAIFARDQQSYDYARPLVMDDVQMEVCPDITITTSAKCTPMHSHDYACLVVNSKLLEPNPQQQQWADTYMQRLTTAGRHLISRGLELLIVEHEYTSRDRQLAEQVRSNIGDEKCAAFAHSDPQVLKYVLGGSRLVVGSRFHSLVSSLSMGVPAIALGWAHKYDALLADFGVPMLIHYAKDRVEHLVELIDNTLDHRDEVSSVISDNRVLLGNRVDAMWNDVAGRLGVDRSAVPRLS